MMSSERSRVPFTATQWQELEHQALIFKYMVSGVPIPSDLLYTIRRSLDSSLSSKLNLHQPRHIGWSCFPVGYGRKIDPDPGRCRRTDGKKWRCSKEAYPDSKYCERHMHRGRNRSRKSVELMTTAAVVTTTTHNSIAPLTVNTSLTATPTGIPMLLNTKESDVSSFRCTNGSPSSLPFDYSLSSSSMHKGFGFSSPAIDNNNDNPVLDSTHYLDAGKDYRNSCSTHGIKEVGEHTFLSGASGDTRSMSSSSSVNDSWQLGMGHSYNFQLHSSFDDTSKQQRKYQNYYAPPPSSQHAKNDKKSDHHQLPKKVMHHFFDDEWPPKGKDSWLHSEDKCSSNDLSLSKTQLSISIPNSSHDFFVRPNEK